MINTQTQHSNQDWAAAAFAAYELGAKTAAALEVGSTCYGAIPAYEEAIKAGQIEAGNGIRTCYIDGYLDNLRKHSTNERGIITAFV